MTIFRNRLALFATASSLSTITTIFLNINPANAISTIGDSLIDRGFNDGASGSIFVVPDSFGSTTEELTMWSIFDNENSGGQVTPLILEDIGSSYTIRGIGTTRASDASGVQSFNFDLVSGSADVGGNLFFAWKDGSNGTNNQGVIDFSSDNSDLITWLGNSRTSFNVGDNFSVASNFGRSYSIQASATTSVPFEFSPTTGLILSLGLFSTHYIGKKREQKEIKF